MNHSINPSSIKEKIVANKSTLINITEVNGVLLTELVGQGVMEEPTEEIILDGRTRTGINKRFFEWLTESDDVSVYKFVLSKLREYGQKHIANLLDGTPGELPLSHTVRRHLQKIVRELTENIDLGSGLLESLQALGVITETDCENIKEDKKPKVQAKCLWDVLLRGSDLAFEKFKEEIVKTQPDMIKLIDQQEGSVDKPHVNQLKKHCDVLTRCMDVNLLTIAYLESKGAIDGGMADSLKSTEMLSKKANQVYNFLLVKPKACFDFFLQAMEENEQKHVANLLMENFSGQQPLAERDHKRLVKIKPDLIKRIHNNVTLMSALLADRESEEADSAISQNDYEVVTVKFVTNTDKNSALIDAVLRRTDYSLKSLEAALRLTEQKHMADFLKEGIVFGVDVKTTRTDKEEEIANLGNQNLANQSSDEPSSEEERQFAEDCNLLASLGMPMIATEVSNSIMIYSYCKRPADAERYVKYLKSGQLQTIYERMLNLLLKIIEPDSYVPLEAAIILKEEDKNIIQEFIDESDTAPSCPQCGKSMDIFSYDSSSTVCSSCVKQEDQSHGCSDVNEEIVSQRKKLQEDLQLVSSCRSQSIELKESFERNHANFVRQLEEKKAAVSKKCDDLKEKVENFKQMLFRDQETFKKRVESDMGERIRALESYGSVVSDFEDRLRLLMERGTSVEICKSYETLHERAVKLQKMPEQPASSAIEIFQGYSELPQLIPEHLEESHSVEICKKLVTEQKSFLVDYLDAESGLLEQLVGLRALTEETAAEISKPSSHQEMNRKLIESIITDDKCQQLVSSLAASKQSYLINYLESQGKYDPKYGLNWPILESERNHLDSMRDQIPCLLIPVYFNWLQSINVLNSWHINLILSKPSPEAKCDVLLEILKRGSRNDFVNVTNLLATYQAQSHQKARSFVENCLDPGLFDVLKPHLSAKEIRSIKSERSPQKRNVKLVDVMCASNKYDEFIRALVETGQKHFVNCLNAKGIYDPKFADEWPVAFTPAWEILKGNRKYLVDNLKLLDILDDLVSKNVINSKQRETLSLVKSKHTRNEAFVDMLGRGSIENYNKTVEYFHSSGQTQIAIWLGRPPEPAFGRVQVQVQVQVNLEQERAELLSVFNEVMALRQLCLNPLEFGKQ